MGPALDAAAKTKWVDPEPEAGDSVPREKMNFLSLKPATRHWKRIGRIRKPKRNPTGMFATGIGIIREAPGSTAWSATIWPGR